MARPSIPFIGFVPPPLDADVNRLIELLHLSRHPEGGFFVETFRAAGAVAHPQTHATRSASTAIYFLLPRGSFSAFHRVRSDEVWHHYDGGTVEIHTIVEEYGAPPTHRVERLGRDLVAGERPQVVVPGGVWQAALPVGDRYSLCGCTVAPGFDFADFELPTRETLIARFPTLSRVIERLTNG